jgi:hypothetical protein
MENQGWRRLTFDGDRSLGGLQKGEDSRRPVFGVGEKAERAERLLGRADAGFFLRE